MAIPVNRWEPKSMNEVEDDELEKAEYNMGAYHYARYHEILKFLDECSIQVLAFNPDNNYRLWLHAYYSTLKTLYNNIRPNLLPKIAAAYDILFKKAEKERIGLLSSQSNGYGDGIITYPSGYIRILEDLHAKLIYSVHRQLGLGYPRIKSESFSSAAERKIVGVPKIG